MNLSFPSASGSPFGFVTAQEVNNQIAFAFEQAKFNLWWKAAIGFCVAYCAASLLKDLGVLNWLIKKKIGYYLAFRQPPQDDKGNGDDKKEDEPPKTGDV